MRVLLTADPAADEPDLRGADALVLTHAPRRAPDWLAPLRRTALYVRVAPEASDLDAALALRPDGIVLPRIARGADIARLGLRLAVHEAEAGRADGGVRILAGLGTADAMLRLATLPGSSPRLSGLFCDEAALARDLRLDGAGDARTAPLRHARAGVVLAAAACGVPAIDFGLEPHDGDALARSARAARRDGFRGGVARDAAGAAILRRIFGPA